MNTASLIADPQERAAQSARREAWTLKPPVDVRRLVARAIKELGRNKPFWIYECVRLGLAERFGGKNTRPPVVLKKASSK